MSAGCARFYAGGQEHLQRCFRKNDGAHVATIGNEPRTLPKSPLARNQRRPNLRVHRDCRRAIAYVFSTNFRRYVHAVKLCATFAEGDVEGGDEIGERVTVLRIDVVTSPCGCRQPEKRAAIEEVKTERGGDQRCNRALARS